MENIEDHKGLGGKREDFEQASAHLLPKYPVLKKKEFSSETFLHGYMQRNGDADRERKGRKWDWR